MTQQHLSNSGFSSKLVIPSIILDFETISMQELKQIVESFKRKFAPNLDELERVLGSDSLDLVAVVTAEQDAEVDKLVLGHLQTFQNLK